MKRTAAFLLSVILMISAISFGVSANNVEPFTDVKSTSWYAEAIGFCYDNGIISGTSETTFSPGMKLSRAMFVTMLARVANAELSEYTESSFNDVKAEQWYTASVEWAYQNNITGGTGNENFSPEKSITREEICRLFHNFLKSVTDDIYIDYEILDYYEDKSEISDWALEDVTFAVSNGLITSTELEAYVISPKMTVTRAQAAQFFMNFKTVFASVYPLDSKNELDNRCRASAEIGENKILKLVWEGESTTVSIADGSEITLEKGRKYSICFTRTDSLGVSYSAVDEIVWTLTLDLKGGEMADDAQYIFREGDSYSSVFGEKLPIPTLKGYTFEYWYCEEKDEILDINNSFNYEENVTFTAVWTANEYTVSFDPNGGILSGEKAFSAVINESYAEILSGISEPSLKGHCFAGWYYEKEDYLLDLTDNFEYDEDITFKARWTPNVYTISFDANGGEFSGKAEYEIEYGQHFSDVVAELPLASLKGNEFHGWYNEKNDYTLNISDTYTFTEDITLSALWQPIEYTLSFDPDGGELEGKTSFSVFIHDNYADVLSELTDPIRLGYEFSGWYCEGKNYTLDSADSFEYTENITFKALWAPNVYTITFENGEKYSVEYGQRIIEVISEIPSVNKEGYTFNSWYCESENYTLELADTYNFTEDIAFKAEWIPNKYTVSFDADGGILDGKSEYYIDYDQEWCKAIPEEPKATMRGHSFKYWYCEEYDHVLDLSPDIRYVINEDITFIAVWEPIEYTLSFDPDGGELEGETSFSVFIHDNYADVLSGHKEPVRTGYEFKGWYCEGKNYTLDLADRFEFAENISFKALWTPNVYTVTFENGENFSVEYGQRISEVISAVPVADKTGYSFVSWYSEVKDYTLNISDAYHFTDDISFKAIWSPNAYTVTFDPDMGYLEGEAEYNIDYDQAWAEAIPAAPKATRNGYSFEYWYCEKYNYKLDLNPEAVYSINEDITFIAVWKPITYYICFDSNGGELDSQTVYEINYGQKLAEVISEVPNATLKGYKFCGWRNKDSNFALDLSSEYTYTENTVFVASWEPVEYRISFDPNGGELEGETSFTAIINDSYFDVLAELRVPVRRGHDFSGWYCESKDYILNTSESFEYAENISFIALWSPITYRVTFDPDIGEMDDSPQYSLYYGQVLNEVITFIPSARLAGHTLDYWYCEEENIILDISDSFEFENDITFKAVYEPIEYTVTFDPAGGTLTGERVYRIKYGQSFSEAIPLLPSATNDFYELQYWYCEGSNYIFDSSDSYTFTENITLTAVWKDEDPYQTATVKIAEYRQQMSEQYSPEQRDEEVIDLILFAGQSNSSGRATADEITNAEDKFMTVDKSKAFTFYNNKYTEPMEIIEPIPGNGTDDKYYGYIPAFLNSYYDSTGRRACACFKSVGGMMLNKFLPYTIDENGNETDTPQKYYTEMVEYINYAKANLEANGYTVGNIFMVWCQGEADAAYYGYENEYANVIEEGITEYEDKIEYYKGSFIRMFESLQRDTGMEKVFFVRIGHSNKTEECLRNQCIIDAHSELCREEEDFVMVSTLFAGAKTFRLSDGTVVNLMRDASHYVYEGYLMAGMEAGINAAIYVNSNFEEKPKLFEYHTYYLETQGIYDDNEYEHEYQRYIYDPED